VLKLLNVNKLKLKPNIIMPNHYGKTDMKKKYAGKKFTPLIGRGTSEERKNTREFAKDLDDNRKAKNKKRLKKFKAFVNDATAVVAATVVSTKSLTAALVGILVSLSVAAIPVLSVVTVLVLNGPSCVSI